MPILNKSNKRYVKTKNISRIGTGENLENFRKLCLFHKWKVKNLHISSA